MYRFEMTRIRRGRLQHVRRGTDSRSQEEPDATGVAGSFRGPHGTAQMRSLNFKQIIQF